MLEKRTAGQPLSDAEHKQRQDAARARWHAGLIATGALVGGAAGAARGAARMAIASQNDVVTRTRAAGVRAAETASAAERRVQARTDAREQAIRDAIRFRRRANPDTQAERRRRLADAIEGMRNPRPVRRETRPVIGTPENARIYDYQIDQAARRLKVEERHLDRLKRAEQDAFEGSSDAQAPSAREMRAQTQRVARLTREIAELTNLKSKAHATVVRRGTQRTRGETTTDVRPTTADQFRGGETKRQIKNRILSARRDLDEREGRLLAQSGRTATRLRTIARENAFEDAGEAVRRAFVQGRYGARIARAAGRAGLVGAGIGVAVGAAAAGAHWLSGRHVEKLAKAEPDPPPPGPDDTSAAEKVIALRLAETFRNWTAQLVSQTPTINLESDLERAFAPLTQVFREGASRPPIDVSGSDPRVINFDFDKLNPAVREHMQSYTLDRIREISDEQREAVRAILQSAIADGAAPADMALRIKETIGLTAAQGAMVQGFRKQLEALDVRALDRQLRDKRFDRTLRRAIDTDTPLSGEQVQKMVDAYHRRFVALRAMTIARTEALRAANYGNLAGMRRFLDAHQDATVIKTWRATEDEHTRDTHRELDGRQQLGLDTPWITSTGDIIRWPHDDKAPAREVVRCRCTLQFTVIPKSTAVSRFLTADNPIAPWRPSS